MTQAIATPKQRMLNAYRGTFSDRWPVAPEFWYYYPARVLGVDMIRFQLEVPFWQALQTTFKKFACEGWGATFPAANNPRLPGTTRTIKTSDTQLRQETTTRLGNREFVSVQVFDAHEPSWLVQYPVQDPAVLHRFQERFIEFQVEQIRRACRETPFESFCLGCAYSCNSLIGPRLWRQWDKPVIRAIAAELHRRGRLLHIHFHGRCLDTVADFAEIGIDCVCPFERPPGGDVEGLEGLAQVRKLLAGKVAMNGNVHTVETLIRGTPDQVRNEVRQIREAFKDEPRLVIGTGDQVGRETPEENLWAMIEEAKRPH